jgi:hypothetical protein
MLGLIKTLVMIVAAFLLVLWVVLWPYVRLEVTKTPIKVQAEQRLDFLELYGLSNAESEQYPVRIVDAEGSVWYREKEPGLTLACCSEDRLFATEQVTGGFAVVLRVNEACRDDLAAWSKARIGTVAGVVVDGKLIYVQRLQGEMRSQIAIPVAGTLEDAEALAERIRTEGFKLRGPYRLVPASTP